ncbi:MAG TPA: hypothetical protein VFP56_10145 [Candidatus Limnocylindrales bacterium]|nr:hypothetical protein [Candidatus Limnocylindrales bacterium]
MGARTDAARAEVLAARAGLDEELVRLEASGRAAVDIPARLKREPAKVLGTAGGAAFLLLGGPKRVFKGVRRAILGPKADMPKSMLPKEIDQELRKMGDDGERVRRKLEREFANYLDENAEARKERDLGATTAVLLGGVLKPVVQRFGKQLAERALDPDSGTFAEALKRTRERQNGAKRNGSHPPGGNDTAPL